jgi:hypothetical protein
MVHPVKIFSNPLKLEHQTKCKKNKGNVDALLKIPKATVNVFGTLNWVRKEGCCEYQENI